MLQYVASRSRDWTAEQTNAVEALLSVLFTAPDGSSLEHYQFQTKVTEFCSACRNETTKNHQIWSVPIFGSDVKALTGSHGNMFDFSRCLPSTSALSGELGVTDQSCSSCQADASTLPIRRRVEVNSLPNWLITTLK